MFPSEKAKLKEFATSDDYFVIISWWSRFAPGVTGVNYYLQVFYSFKEKKDAKVFQNHWKQAINKKDKSGVLFMEIHQGPYVEQCINSMKESLGQRYPSVSVCDAQETIRNCGWDKK